MTISIDPGAARKTAYAAALSDPVAAITFFRSFLSAEFARPEVMEPLAQALADTVERAVRMQIASRGDVCAGEVDPHQQDVPHDEPLAEDCGEHPASGNEPVPADENDGRPDIVQAASTPLDHPSPSVAIEPITIAESSFEWDKEGFRAFLVSKGFTPRTVQNRIGIIIKIIREVGHGAIAGLGYDRDASRRSLSDWTATGPAYLVPEVRKAVADYCDFLDRFDKGTTSEILGANVSNASHAAGKEDADVGVGDGEIIAMPAVSSDAVSDFSFSFADVESGLGAMRMAGESAAGYCLSTAGMGPDALSCHRAYFGTQYPDLPDGSAADVIGISLRSNLIVPLDDLASIIEFRMLDAMIAPTTRAFVVRSDWTGSESTGIDPYRIAAFLSRNGFTVQPLVIDTSRYVPMHGAELFLIGHRNGTKVDLSVEVPDAVPAFRDLLHKEDGSERAEAGSTTGEMATVLPIHRVSAARDRKRAILKGTVSSFCHPCDEGHARRLGPLYSFKPAAAVVEADDGHLRRLTPREVARVLGFPDDFPLPPNPVTAYGLLGASCPVPVATAVMQGFALTLA